MIETSTSFLSDAVELATNTVKSVADLFASLYN